MRAHTLIFALLALLIAGLAPGQQAEAARTSGKALTIEIDKGQMVTLKQPAASVFIANPEIADLQVMSPTVVYVYGRRQGETQLFAIDQRGGVLIDRPITVNHNLKALRTTLAAVLPGHQVTVRSVEMGILLTGQVDSPAQAEDARRLASRFLPATDGAEVINRLTTSAPTQVNLRVRIAEVSRSVGKDFGINWENIAQLGNYTLGFGFGSGAGSAVSNAIAGGGNLFLGFNTGSVDVNGLVDALATEGLVSVLAEPNLTALSGETASFLAGGEYPIPVPGEDRTVTIEYREFGVSLAFTPTLTGNERINLRVRPEVSQLSATGAVVVDGFEIPAVSTRRAETTVELGSGESFAIAGLLRSDTTNNITKFPFLGDLPVLGALFRSNSFNTDESELVIIVTPYLVEPTGEALAVPTDSIILPNDVERIWHGRLEGQQRSHPAGSATPGPVGYILD
ncbi:type II and III secretion system protein family protein [Rhodovibrionaceae bacterium A322]